MPVIPYRLIGELNTAQGLNDIIDALGGAGVAGGSNIIRDQVTSQTGTTINFTKSYPLGNGVLFYRNGVLMDEVISFSGGTNNAKEFQEATATSITLNGSDPAVAGENFEFVSIENSIVDGIIEDARSESDGSGSYNCTVSTVSNKTNVALDFIYSTGRNFGGVKGDLNVEVNGQSIERLLPGINDNAGDVVYEEVDSGTIEIYEIVSVGPTVTAELAPGLLINISKVKITVGQPEQGGVNGVDTTANLLLLPREEGRIYYSIDEDVLKTDDGATLNNAGGGGGDFLSNGSVAMSGDLNLGSQNIIDVASISGIANTDISFGSKLSGAGVSGKAYFQSGETGGSGLASGQVHLRSGNATGGNPTGNVFIYSGDTAVGPSGDVTLEIGSTSGSKGDIIFKDGSEGTAGHVWTSTNTAGAGEWQAPAGGGGGSVESVCLKASASGGWATSASNTSWKTQSLPTIDGSITGASSSGGGVELPAGTYQASCLFGSVSGTGMMSFRLYNSTDASAVEEFNDVYHPHSGGTNNGSATVPVLFTLAATKTIVGQTKGSLTFGTERLGNILITKIA